MTNIFLALALFITININAQEHESKKPNGQKLFAQKCANCHGTSFIRPRVPNLFGQEPGYIVNQLKAFKSGERVDRNARIMNTVAKSLKDDEMMAMAKYLAGEDQCDMRMREIDTKAPGFIEKYRAGQKIVKDNNCMHCHGSFHHAAPRLHGQRLKYLEFTLTEFMNGDRKNKYMDRILPILDNDSIEKISIYFNTQRLMRECAD